MLTDKAVRAASAQDKAYKLTDARGLHLHVSTSGHKSWRYKYRFENKERLVHTPTFRSLRPGNAGMKRKSSCAKVATLAM